MSSSADLLKTLQVQFLMVAARWANYGTEIEATSLGLPSLVCLLQSVGYAIRRIDSVSPENMSPLRNNQKGTKVTVTCGHSGQRCVLELPEEPEDCKCIVKDHENSQDSFWEVTASNPARRNSSIIETGSDAVPAVSKELNALLRHTLISLTHMIQGTLKNVDPDDAGSGQSATNSNTSSPKKGAKRLSGFIQELINVPIIISSPKSKESPARRRSLDALNVSPNERIRTPGLLTPKIPRTKEKMITQSSPHINLFGKSGPTDSSGSTMEEAQNEKVIKLLEEAISLLKEHKSQMGCSEIPNTNENQQDTEMDKEMDKKTDKVMDKKDKETTFSKEAKPNFKGVNALQPKSASSPSMTMKRKIKSNSASRIPTTPNENGGPARHGSAKLPNKFSNLVAKSKSPKVAEDTKAAGSKGKKITNLYAHVKSTIPKASPTGNYVTKKS